MAAIRQDLLKNVSPFFCKPLLPVFKERSEDLFFHFIDTDSQLQLYNIERVHCNKKSLLATSCGSYISGVDVLKSLT